MFSIDAERVSRVPNLHPLLTTAHRRLLLRVYIGADGDLRWRKNLAVFPVDAPAAAKRFGLKHGGKKVLGTRLCYGHGKIVCAGGNYYISGDLVDCLRSMGACEEENDLVMGLDYFKQLYARIAAHGARWPLRQFHDNTKDCQLQNIAQKALVYTGREEEIGLTLREELEVQYPQLVKQWLMLSIEKRGGHLVWKRTPVRGGPNAIYNGDPVRGMPIEPHDRVITVSQVSFIGADLYYFFDHGRFPWDEEINWDD